MNSKIQFLDKYKANLVSLINNIDNEVIIDCIERIEAVEKNKGRIFVAGNGGSSATASHMANDLSTGLKRRNILTLDVISLCDNASIATALANDIGFENIFYMQLKDIIKPQDTLIAISCSGNSSNIVQATKYSKEIGSTIIGLTGFTGGALKELSDINIHFETSTNDYGLVEDAHMILNHILFSYFCQEHNGK